MNVGKIEEVKRVFLYMSNLMHTHKYVHVPVQALAGGEVDVYKKQLIKDWCGRSWNMEAQFGTLTLMASRKNWKRYKIVRQGL